MQIEQKPQNPPNFILVVYMFAAAIVLIVLGAIIVISWRGKKNQKPPYNKAPTALLAPAPLFPQPFTPNTFQLAETTEAA